MMAIHNQRSTCTSSHLLLFSLLLLRLSIRAAIGFSAAPPQRVALVTGSNKGIGKEIAHRLSQDPNTVTIIACRNDELGKQACDELSKDCQSTSKVVQVTLDLVDENSITSAAEFVKETYGHIDVLINNAAICFNDPTLYGKVAYTPFEEQADITIRTNFFGTLRVTQAMLPLLQSSGSKSPRIINIASAAGRLAILKSKDLVETVTSPDLTLDALEALMKDFVQAVQGGTHADKGYPNTCYGMSKLGIIAMTKLFSRTYPDIMCNAVDPGYCATDQNNNQGFVKAERGAFTPYLLATLPKSEFDASGKYFYEEQEIKW